MLARYTTPDGAPTLAPAGVQVGVAVPFVYIDAVSQAVAGSSLQVGAQDAYCENFGAFTHALRWSMRHML